MSRRRERLSRESNRNYYTDVSTFNHVVRDEYVDNNSPPSAESE